MIIMDFIKNGVTSNDVALFKVHNIKSTTIDTVVDYLKRQ